MLITRIVAVAVLGVSAVGLCATAKADGRTLRMAQHLEADALALQTEFAAHWGRTLQYRNLVVLSARLKAVAHQIEQNHNADPRWLENKAESAEALIGAIDREVHNAQVCAIGGPFVRAYIDDVLDTVHHMQDLADDLEDYLDDRGHHGHVHNPGTVVGRPYQYPGQYGQYPYGYPGYPYGQPSYYPGHNPTPTYPTTPQPPSGGLDPTKRYINYMGRLIPIGDK